MKPGISIVRVIVNITITFIISTPIVITTLYLDINQTMSGLKFIEFDHTFLHTTRAVTLSKILVMDYVVTKLLVYIQVTKSMTKGKSKDRHVRYPFYLTMSLRS